MKNKTLQIGIKTSPIIIQTTDNVYKCYANPSGKYLVFDMYGANLGWKTFNQLEYMRNM